MALTAHCLAIRIEGPEATAAAAVAALLVLVLITGIGLLTWRLAKLPADGGSAHEPSALAWVRDRPVLGYFLLAYGFSWVVWVPVALGANGIRVVPLRVPVAIAAAGSLGPIAAAFILTAAVSGRPGLRSLLHRFVDWRLGLHWYAFATFALPLVISVGVFAVVPGGLTAARHDALPTVLVTFVGAFVAQVFISGLLEEPGWRGFALPRLQASNGPLVGSLILGMLWGSWHLPLFLIPGFYIPSTGLIGVGVPMVESLARAVAATIVFTWVWNNTRGSLVIAIMMHASVDALPLSSLSPSLAIGPQRYLAGMIAIGALALILVAATRGRLGYRGVSACIQPQSAPTDMRLSRP